MAENILCLLSVLLSLLGLFDDLGHGLFWWLLYGHLETMCVLMLLSSVFCVYVHWSPLTDGLESVFLVTFTLILQIIDIRSSESLAKIIDPCFSCIHLLKNCVYECFSSMCICLLYVQCPQRPEQDIRLPRTGLIWLWVNTSILELNPALLKSSNCS